MARESVVTSSVTDVVKWGILKGIVQRIKKKRSTSMLAKTIKNKKL